MFVVNVICMHTYLYNILIFTSIFVYAKSLVYTFTSVKNKRNKTEKRPNHRVLLFISKRILRFANCFNPG